MEEQVTKPELAAQIADLPDKPGVYLFKNKKKKIIYIGKARNLKKRIRSYFTGDKDIKTQTLKNFIYEIEVVITRNEYEALLLENSLIKQWKPRYNINLKDGKSYPVIRITHDEFPGVFRTRRLFFDGSDYFGPFPSANQIDLYLEIIEHYFPLRKCKGTLKKKDHPCLYYHIKRCMGPCCGKISEQEYLETVKKIKQLLSGKIKELIIELRKKMADASDRFDYEKAAQFRDQIYAVEHVKEVQSVVDTQKQAKDYIGFAVKEHLCSFVVLQHRGGIIAGREIYSLEFYTGKEEALLQFVLQYYSSIQFIPDELFLPVETDYDTITSFLLETAGKKISVKTPQKGKHVKIIKMAEENAKEDIENRIKKLDLKKTIDELRITLCLAHRPSRIEGFDISHIAGEYTVGSMVSFLNGLADKSSYRYFKIRRLKPGEVDDYESIREVIARRYTRVLNENLKKPDLILIDGGKGQVSAAFSILHKLGMDTIPLIGLAKKNEEIFFPGEKPPLVLDKSSPSLRLLQAVRDESHRFAISLNKKLRKKSISHSLLEKIKGIGPKKSIKLLKEFGSIRKIVEAGPGKVAEAIKLPREKAEEVITELKGLYMNGRISPDM
ncbi:MAG: excinuclease ABC subunit UvrC [Spirochaetales bacterium]|nr:excinuclease ABC subunit UvrC [Spirochaetales bacterium]